jgi:hypothetical protein
MHLPHTFSLPVSFEPYRPNPSSAWRVKLSFRVDFTNDGHISGEGFLLDISDHNVKINRVAEMLVSALNLLRAGPVTIFMFEVVHRGENDD